MINPMTDSEKAVLCVSLLSISNLDEEVKAVAKKTIIKCLESEIK